MSTKFSLMKRLRYSLDNLYSRGTGMLIFSLATITLAIITLAALVLILTQAAPAQEPPYNFSEAMWTSLLRILGSGAFGGRGSMWGYRLIMLAVTLGSIFIYSSMIGVLTNGMRSRLEALRKGRSEVVEIGHTVILGWSEQIFTIVSELVIANASERHACIVILGERDIAGMEEAIRSKVGSTGRTRIVYRSGNPLEPSDLSITSLNTASSILIPSPDSSNPDADVLKIVLAILHHPQRRPEPYHIVACLRSPKNKAVAHIIGQNEVEWMQTGDIVSRIIAQTSRQSGLSVIYNELLSFSDNSIYFYDEPRLVGKTFGEALLNSFADTVIGIAPKGEKPQLNPPMDRVFEPGDRVLVIARDNDSIQFDPGLALPLQEEAVSIGLQPDSRPERTLILGWNWRGIKVIQELDHYVAPGSEVKVVADREGILQSIERDCHNLKNQQICYQHGETTDPLVLEQLSLDDYDHIILLCYSDRLSIQQADAQTLITLLQLRDIADRNQYRYSIVSEMLDVRNRKLALVTRADDFIVSDRIISMLMAQVSQNKSLNHIFEDLFDPDTAELYLKPARYYVCPGSPVNFATVVHAARRKGETAIGYRAAAGAHNPQSNYGIVLNPVKDVELSFSDQDCIIVLAEG